ncbi:inactive protein RESTRICTED TEV MOVEMENT 1-like [Lycium barbarum]|uniref:inactive protein RESTRICTED TEV MOVEMENT 1-like n=1 Tax=Lycium barbarum TaxID=112863 RepID=UPI00293F451B|nr:inactive protein RESTRICTED TEV MOVEMENT 1-like [Lycium barbarum]
MDLVKVGPAGVQSQRGTLWDEKGREEVAQMFAAYNHNTIYSVQFLFYENSKLVSEKHGVDRGSNFNSVVLDYPSERLTSISGSFRLSVNGTQSTLSSISFGTKKGSYGPFGSNATDDRHFNFQIGKHGTFGGFHGSGQHT